jgi:hypothetical protein
MEIHCERRLLVIARPLLLVGEASEWAMKNAGGHAMIVIASVRRRLYR